jgi:hypothetical protein
MAKRTPERKESRRAIRATRKLAKNERKLEREKRGKMFLASGASREADRPFVAREGAGGEANGR